MRNAAPIFQTQRLIARPWTLEDAESAFQMYGNPEVMKFLGANGAAATVSSVEVMRERLEIIIQRFTEDPDLKSYVHAALERKEDGRIVGTTLLKPIPFSSGDPATDVEVGWHLIPEFWGQGYATESGHGAIEYGFGTLGLSEIQSVAYAENGPSLKVMERLGLERLGPTEMYYGIQVEHYRITRDAWANS
jgi:RimJ/RimL family protein N-acetyltransferase